MYENKEKNWGDDEPRTPKNQERDFIQQETLKCNVDPPPKRPEHVITALSIAEVMMNFDPVKQNEMIQIVRETVSCKRNEELDRLMKQYEFLKQSMNRI